MAATGTPTPNIGLRIPQGTDPASVDDINYNSNLIDTKLGAVGNDSVQDQIDSLNSNIANKFKIITSGSLHDLAGQSGVFWLTSSVTDKPQSGAGIFIINSYGPSYCSGIFVDTDLCKSYTISFVNNTWTYRVSSVIDVVEVTGTTSGTGAVDVPLAYRSKWFLNALLTTGDTGFVIRRDVNYFTVFNNDGTPKTNTNVVFNAYFSI